HLGNRPLGLEVDPHLLLPRECDKGATARMRDVEAQSRALVAEARLAAGRLRQLEPLRRRIQVPPGEDAQQAPRQPQAAPVALEMKALPPCALLRGERPREGLGIPPGAIDTGTPHVYVSFTEGNVIGPSIAPWLGDGDHAGLRHASRSSATAANSTPWLSSGFRQKCPPGNLRMRKGPPACSRQPSRTSWPMLRPLYPS